MARFLERRHPHSFSTSQKSQADIAINPRGDILGFIIAPETLPDDDPFKLHHRAISDRNFELQPVPPFAVSLGNEMRELASEDWYSFHTFSGLVAFHSLGSSLHGYPEAAGYELGIAFGLQALRVVAMDVYDHGSNDNHQFVLKSENEPTKAQVT